MRVVELASQLSLDDAGNGSVIYADKRTFGVNSEWTFFGMFDSSLGVGTNFTIWIEGRPDSTAAWWRIDSVTQASAWYLSTGNIWTIGVAGLAMFPEMRIEIDGSAGAHTGLLDAWAVE